jgi:hypothetical protein
MILAYKKETDTVSKNGAQCPPSEAVATQIAAWRWVFNPIFESCFYPQGLRYPPRLHRATDPDEQCSCWAVSMHSSYQQSVSAFQALESHFKKARKILGDHVAKADIGPSAGICTPVECSGHFDFHPFKDFDMATTFTIEGVIP